MGINQLQGQFWMRIEFILSNIRQNETLMPSIKSIWSIPKMKYEYYLENLAE